MKQRVSMCPKAPVVFRKSLVLSGEQGAEGQALQLLEELRAFFCLPAEALADFRLAVVEACLNALEHGAPPVEAEVEGRQEEGGVRVQVVIRDHGSGFSPKAVPQPELLAKLRSEQKRGWGLAMMQRFADRLEISSREGLTEVRLWRVVQNP